jgi:hypothetical protein
LYAAAISVVILLDLALNTARSMVSSKWQDNAAWSSSAAVKNLAAAAQLAVMKVADLHDG